MKKIVCVLMLFVILFSMLPACSNDDLPQQLTDCQQARSLIENGRIQEAYALLRQSDERGAAYMLDNFAFIPLSICYDNNRYREFFYNADGNLLRTTLYINGKVYQEDIYTYYASGNIHTSESKGSLDRRTIVYDEKGQITSYKRIDSDNSWSLNEYTYDVYGKKTSSKVTSSKSNNVEYTTYSYDQWGNCVYSHTLIQNSYTSTSNSSRYTYNEFQKLTSEEHTFPNGVSKKLYEYDSTGNLIRREEISVNGLSLVYLYERNSEGKPIKKTTINSNGSVSNDLYEYDQFGNEICNVYVNDGVEKYRVENIYDEMNCQLEYAFIVSGKVFIKETYTYDEYGNVLVRIRSVSDDPDEYDRFNYVYDEFGRIVDVIHFDMENRMSSHQEYAYNEFGHIVSVQKYDDHGAIRLDYSSEIELRYYPNGVPVTIQNNWDDHNYQYQFEYLTE